MNKIRSLYNQNKRTIWVSVLIIIGVIALIQTLNSYYKNNTKEKSDSSSTNISTTTNATNNYSVITREKINENTSIDSEDLIKDFFNYCNNGKFDEAYNMLSEDCKQEVYPNIEYFKQNYCNKIFNETKMYNSTLWITNKGKNTYRLEIMGDILATGKKENMPIEDYYTVVNENGEYKLNISRYIGKEDLNSSKELNEITVIVVSRKTYIGYENYEVKVQNRTGKKIVFNTKENTGSMYLEDEKGVKNLAFLNELSEYELGIPNGYEKTLNIKFDREYKPRINVKKIVFGDIKIEGNEEKQIIEIDV